MWQKNSKWLLANALPMAALGVGAWAALKAVTGRKRFDYAGKVVLVTGGSRGLGLVMARELIHQGAHVVICAREQDELDRAFHDLAGRGGHVLAIPCDMTQNDQVEAMVQTVLQRWGHIDVLINNAGIISVGPFETMTVEDYRNNLETNYMGPLYAILAVIPGMRQRGEGRIVNVTSIGGKVSVPHLLPYSASKFALVGLSEGLRSELAKDGIIVTTICPGLMRTGSPRNALFKGQNQAEYAWFSISDSLPLLTISAETAASQILRACQHGISEVVLSIPAKLAVLFHDLFPSLTTDLLSWVNRLLPADGGIGKNTAKGKDSESAVSPSWLTSLTEKAAERNNEFGPNERNRIRGSNGHHGPDKKQE